MALDLYELALRFKSEGFRAVSKDMDTLDKKGKGIAKAFSALKASLIVGAVGGFIRKIAVESIEAQKQTAQLNAVLKSTGGIADVTASEIDKIAGSLQRTTVFSDDAVKSSASLLLTFTNIRGEIFRQTLPAITDMATALGTDLNSATLQVGKALQDPVRGITALRRAGVSFSEAQQAVIKNLVETNRLAEAQGIILKELSVQFGGSAAAARNTLGGALEGLKNSWGELFEVTTDSSRGIVGAINSLSDALDRNKEKWHSWASAAIDQMKKAAEWANRIIELQNKLGRWLHGGTAGGEGRGGGGGGGRDTPTGPLSFDPAVVMAGKPVSLGGGGGGSGKQGKFDFPMSDRIEFEGLRTPFESQEATNEGAGDWLRDLFAENDKRQEAFRRFAEETAAEAEAVAKQMRERLTNILGDAIYNGFAAAFNGEGLGGIFKAFGKTVLSGLGGIFVDMGTKMVAASALMETFRKALIGFIPGGGIVAGLALIALGSAMGAMGGGRGAAGSASRGVSGAGSFKGSEDITRYKFIDRNGSLVNSLKPAQPLVFNVFGNTPEVQRFIGETSAAYERRRG